MPKPLPTSVKMLMKRFLSQTQASKIHFQRVLDSLEDHGSVHDTFANVDDAFWLWAHVEGHDKHALLRRKLPLLPESDVQIRFTGKAGAENLEQGFAAYACFKVYLDQYRLQAPNDAKEINILDFGCGWGRILRYWLKDLPPRNIYGVDCLGDAVRLASSLNLGANIVHTQPMPPTDFASGKFSLIYAFSVFSHLSEYAANQWVEEFYRLLVTGGMLCLTTRPREFIWQVGSRFFDEKSRWLNAFDRGEFCHQPTGGGGELDAGFYGESAIPKEYVVSQWINQGFKLVDYLDSTDQIKQNVIILQK